MVATVDHRWALCTFLNSCSEIVINGLDVLFGFERGVPVVLDCGFTHVDEDHI